MLNLKGNIYLYANKFKERQTGKNVWGEGFYIGVIYEYVVPSTASDLLTKPTILHRDVNSKE